jgi:hypothetical protein
MDFRWRRIQYGLNWLTNDSDFREATINGSPSSKSKRALQDLRVQPAAVSCSCWTCNGKHHHQHP